jgi:hypothetical protein
MGARAGDRYSVIHRPNKTRTFTMAAVHAVDVPMMKLSAKMVTFTKSGIVFEFNVPRTITAGEFSAILKKRWDEVLPNERYPIDYRQWNRNP